MTQFYKYAVLRAVALIFVLVYPPAPALYGGEKFNVQEVPLVVQRKSVSFAKILSCSVERIVTTPQYAAFISSRTAWILFAGRKPIPLSKLADLPPGFDWYGTACTLGDKLLISVGTYSEEQIQKDLHADRGGHVEGPRPAGMLVVSFNPPAASLITLLTVSETGHADDTRPAAIRPRFQSCLASGEDLYMGEAGYLARMNPDSLKTELLEFDDELMINRLSIWKEGTTLWYAADDGGAGGSWIEKLDVGGPAAEKISTYTLMNDGMSLPDALVGFKGRLYASSAAGLVEIDEPNRMFIRYQLSKDPKAMQVCKLSVINNQLWGLRGDGWVRFDPDACKAIHYRLRSGNVSNNIKSLGYFDGAWFVATDKEVVRVK